MERHYRTEKRGGGKGKRNDTEEKWNKGRGKEALEEGGRATGQGLILKARGEEKKRDSSSSRCQVKKVSPLNKGEGGRVKEA